MRFQSGEPAFKYLRGGCDKKQGGRLINRPPKKLNKS